MPFASSSFLFLVAMPGAPNSVLAPTSSSEKPLLVGVLLQEARQLRGEGRAHGAPLARKVQRHRLPSEGLPHAHLRRRRVAPCSWIWTWYCNVDMYGSSLIWTVVGSPGSRYILDYIGESELLWCFGQAFMGIPAVSE